MPAPARPAGRTAQAGVGAARRRDPARHRPPTTTHQRQRERERWQPAGVPEIDAPRAGKPTRRRDRARRASAASRPGRHPEQHAHPGEEDQRRLASPAGAPAPAAHSVRRGAPSKHEPDHLHEAQHGQRRGRRQRGSRGRARRAPRRTGGDGEVQERLQRHPLGSEAVERRQPADRHRSDRERAAGPRHAAQKAAEPVELETPDRAAERAGAQEQQGLEDRVVEACAEAPRRTRSRSTGLADRAARRARRRAPGR